MQSYKTVADSMARRHQKLSTLYRQSFPHPGNSRLKRHGSARGEASLYDTSYRNETPAIISAVGIIGDHHSLTARCMDKLQSTFGRIDIYNHAYMTYRRLTHATTTEKYQIADLSIFKRYFSTLRTLKPRCPAERETKLSVDMACKSGAVESFRPF